MIKINHKTLLYLYSIYVSDTFYTTIQLISENYVRSFESDFQNNFLKLSKIDKLEKILQRPNYINFLYKQLKGYNV